MGTMAINAVDFPRHQRLLILALPWIRIFMNSGYPMENRSDDEVGKQ
jgi:hypothetical protein